MNNNRDYQEWLLRLTENEREAHYQREIQLIYGETIILDGNVYDVVVEQHPNGTITVEHIPVNDSCSEGKIPF